LHLTPLGPLWPSDRQHKEFYDCPGNASCQFAFAVDVIQKAEKRGAIGKKRKTIKC
jgi:hypothetical protein